VAEILIQRRRHRSIWPWLLGLLALALLPLPFVSDGRGEATSARTRTTRQDTVARSDTLRRRDTTTSGGGAVSTGGAARSAERASGTAAGAVVPAGSRPAETVTDPAPTSAPSAGTRFEHFIASTTRSGRDSDHREFTVQALHLLADDLRELGASAAGVRAIRANADSLRTNRTRPNANPDHARAAFLAAIRELDLLRARYRVAVDTGSLRSAAWALRPNDSWSAQRAPIERFFEGAREAVQSVSRASGLRRRR
jgi:hypothetical protein